MPRRLPHLLVEVWQLMTTMKENLLLELLRLDRDVILPLILVNSDLVPPLVLLSRPHVARCPRRI